MKSPKQVRESIRSLQQNISMVQEILLRRTDTGVAHIGKECKRTADALGELLKSQQVPDNYKVAVVGRFKTGKSSFVNELLGAKLASEDTNPETAAITTFRFGSKVLAKVSFLSLEEWAKLQTLYEEDPKHEEAHRVKMWHDFSRPRRNRDGDDEVFDLIALAKKYLQPGGFSIQIDLTEEGNKKAEGEFRRLLKEFTSGAKPHHCMVQSIEITSPATILDQGVLLIDTPGLDDTERFRVSLTENIVNDVDAVLFLTKSGVSYSQSEKDFLLTLLRKGTVKQLIVVITQVDQTYDQHVRSAEENDEDPESIGKRIEKERTRIHKEIAATLDELSQEDTPAMARYREQLGNVEIAFTSAVLHRDWKAKKDLRYVIDAADPGGVEQLKKKLLKLLSSESRLALAAHNITVGARSSLMELQSVLHAKLEAIRNIKDKEVAEQKLRTFREQFGEASERFQVEVDKHVSSLESRLEEQRRVHAVLLENIALLANEQLAMFEVNDYARHWKSRRSGSWGYMYDFQGKIANRIFPRVQQMLMEYTEHYANYVAEFETVLALLSTRGESISQSLELGTIMSFDIEGRLEESLKNSIQSAQVWIDLEELVVTNLLNDFISDEVSELITQKREEVSNVFGKGTTKRQGEEVRTFYADIRKLLASALDGHLRDRSESFCNFLIREAGDAPQQALADVQLMLEQAEDNIRAAAAAMVAGQKELAESTVKAIVAECSKTLELIGASIDESDSVNENEAIVDTPMAKVTAKEASSTASLDIDDSWQAQIQRTATVVIKRIKLRDGDTGWPIDRIFAERLLSGANTMCLVDPYLSTPHQIRNLNELLLHVAEKVHPKEIEIVTRHEPLENASHQEKSFEDTKRDLFANYGVALIIRREQNLHDRYLIANHGVLFKLGRGLDIYKPAIGLAAHRSASRKVRQTEIDIFAVPDHPLIQAMTESS
jgi:predicted GTPase